MDALDFSLPLAQDNSFKKFHFTLCMLLDQRCFIIMSKKNAFYVPFYTKTFLSLRLSPGSDELEWSGKIFLVCV